ncbi:hypothetical protein KFL_002690040 [Klebsormidium nitens]|uniref:Calcineurin-like phosphoesterase domain-containing protein n=1 Tax=Klebsormidium nitens TaxID=105231 RepID=A0A1Y1I9H6_KLENI|nr:hypothetical protein KFL_002690040 [Klebsormidium nitens]|eukprot:GAQ86079.1 hypothetical protein KFL_002690040 [Klebsormidium nitens]
MAQLTLLALTAILLLAGNAAGVRQLQQFAPNACNPFSDYPNQCFSSDGSKSICCSNVCPNAPSTDPVCANGVPGVSPTVNTPNATTPAPTTGAPAPTTPSSTTPAPTTPSGPAPAPAPSYTGFPEFAPASTADVSSFVDTYHPTLKFAVIGDVGRIGAPASQGLDQCPTSLFPDNNTVAGQYQLTTAKLLADVCDLNKCSFIVNTGDNFYECGVYPGDNSRLKNDIFDVYNPYVSLSNLVWHSTLGNHDMVIDGSMEQEMSFNNPLWYLPAANFVRDFKSNGVVVRAIFYDENPWIASYNGKGKYDKRWYKQHSNQAYSDAVIAFIENALKTSTAAHTILVSHYPLFGTAVEYGRTASAGLYNFFPRVVALINQYKPVAFFNGHDHILTLGAPGNFSNGFTSYVTTGAGAQHGYSDACGTNRQYSNGGAGGFVVCEATASTFTIKYYTTGPNVGQINTEAAQCTVTSDGASKTTTVGSDCAANLKATPADGSAC